MILLIIFLPLLSGGLGHDTITSSNSGIILGNEGDDVISAKGNYVNEIYVGSGSNKVHAGGGNDLIYLNSGQNFIWGENGDDIIYSGSGKDFINGGDGIDIVDFSDGSNGDLFIALWSGQWMDVGLDNQKQMWNVEGVSTGSGNDRVIGNIYDNVINTGLGNDIIVGADGNDTIVFSSGNNIDISLWSGREQDTGEGIDRIWFVENVTTGSGNDNIMGTVENNIIDAGLGDDIINGLDGEDTLVFSSNNDISVLLWKGSFQNTGEGLDRIWFIENVTTGDGNDLIHGNNDDNIINSGYGNDTINGINGINTFQFSMDENIEINLNVALQNTDAGIKNIRNIQNLDTANGNDNLIGNDLDNYFTVRGGNDIFTGGSGSDVYNLNNAFGQKIITDFEVDDKIENDDLTYISSNYNSNNKEYSVVLKNDLNNFETNLIFENQSENLDLLFIS